MGVAYFKGHMGLVDFLLKMPGVDINFKNDTGNEYSLSIHIVKVN